MNYSQTKSGIVTILSSATLPATVASVTITTTGSPVQVIATGDANPVGAGAWCSLSMYRGSTEVGQVVQCESSASNENIPYCLQVVDTPTAGTYTYSLRVKSIAGSNFVFGEQAGPIITAVELTGAMGPTGVTGPTGPTGPTGQIGPTGSGIPYASGRVNAGVAVTLDNISVQLATSGNRSLQLRTLSGTFIGEHTGTTSYQSGGNQFTYYSAGSTTFNTSYQYFVAWGFPTQGDTAIHHLHDTTNGRCYRITLMIGGGYNNNVIVIERLV